MKIRFLAALLPALLFVFSAKGQSLELYKNVRGIALPGH